MSHHDLRPGHVLGDRYRIDRALGSGAIGTVYAAEDLLLTRPVAVKVIDPDLAADAEVAEAVRRAGSLMASVSHPGLVTVYDATQLGDHYCIVMEMVPGPNLQSLIEDGGVSAQLAARIGSQAAAALQKLHDVERTHGRVTPSNILVTPAGSAKLVDIALGLQEGTVPVSAGPKDDVRQLAASLRASVADPAARDAADLVDVLDAVGTSSNGSAWSAADLAGALKVVADGATPGEVVSRHDADATIVITPIDGPSSDPSGPATEVLPAHDTADLEPTREIAAGGGTEVVDVPTPPRERPLRPAWFGRALLIVAIVAVIAVVATRGDDETSGNSDGGGVTPVAVQGASDFDPLGGGGEHGDEVGLAYDGDPATAWTTEGYEQPNLGGIKAGVGIWFDLGQEVDVRRVDLTLPVAGSDVALYAFNQQPQGGDAGAWGEPVGTLAQAGTNEAVDVAAGTTGRYWLVWITHLGPDGNRYRGGVSEIAFAAR